MDRRLFISGTLGLGLLALISPSFLRSGNAVAARIKKIVKTEAEWRRILTPKQFNILRGAGTERPGSSPLDKTYEPGTYHCAGCDLPLFTSDAKFDSGTGWPSFTQPIADHTETEVDRKFFMSRTEYHCARCGGHQGHVFDDGPAPTGQRWCNNGLSLRFVPQG